MFSGYTSVRNPTLAISIDCASIKDFTLHFIRKTIYIYLYFVYAMLYVYTIAYITQREN